MERVILSSINYLMESFLNEFVEDSAIVLMLDGWTGATHKVTLVRSYVFVTWTIKPLLTCHDTDFDVAL